MNVPDGYTSPAPESGPALYLTYLILPVQRHYEDTCESAYTVPLLMSRN
jgi:hypothetical protein